MSETSKRKGAFNTTRLVEEAGHILRKKQMTLCGLMI